PHHHHHPRSQRRRHPQSPRRNRPTQTHHRQHHPHPRPRLVGRGSVNGRLVWYNCVMRTVDFPRLEKSVIVVAHSFEEAEGQDARYWMSLTPEERWLAVEQMRQVNYGPNHPSTRLQRSFEIAPCPWGKAPA